MGSVQGKLALWMVLVEETQQLVLWMMGSTEQLGNAVDNHPLKHCSHRRVEQVRGLKRDGIMLWV